jgi:hypothetical protein
MDILSRLVDVEMAVETQIVRCDIRLSHLDLQNRTCRHTAEARDKLLEMEHWIEGQIADIIKQHPAYPWFSKIKGVGPENIAKCIGPLRIKPEMGYRKNPDTKELEPVQLPYASHISDCWAYTGYGLDGDHKAMKPKKGEILAYNSTLRSMWWRLANSILKAGLRQKCSKCQKILSRKELSMHTCVEAEFIPMATSRFAQFYLDEKAKYIKRFLNQGCKIVPAVGLPKDGQGKKYEPDGIISEGHIHNMALRKMIKRFQACLFLVWREAEGLPPTKPYVINKLGHNGMVSPWAMTDEE